MRDVKPQEIKRYELSKAESSKPQKKYCNISVDLNTLPEAKNWEPGKEYTVTFKMKMTGLSLRKSSQANDYDYEYNNRAQFDITGVEIKGKPSKADPEDDAEGDE